MLVNILNFGHRRIGHHQNLTLMHLKPPIYWISWHKKGVEIDVGEVAILHKQEIEEYVNANRALNAYLLSVDKPHHLTDRPYWVIKVVLSDLENGDRGEWLYYMEKPNCVQ